MEEHAASLKNYLWSRKRPMEDRELRKKASVLQAEFIAKMPDSGKYPLADRPFQKYCDRMTTLHWNTYMIQRFQVGGHARTYTRHPICAVIWYSTSWSAGPSLVNDSTEPCKV